MSSLTSTLYQVQPVAFTTQGVVIDGDKVGRTIGFPTANLDVNITERQLSPGVYLGDVSFPQALKEEELDLNKTYKGLAYFGPRYIFGELKNSFEVYVYEFDKKIYGQTLKIELSHKLRDPLNITSLAELETRLNQDKSQGQKLLDSLT